MASRMHDSSLMPQAPTKHFGTIEYDEEAVLTFPEGLPAFETLTRFLVIEDAASAPLVFLQSLDDQSICFPAMSPLVVDPDYELSLTPDDLETLEFAGSEEYP